MYVVDANGHDDAGVVHCRREIISYLCGALPPEGRAGGEEADPCRNSSVGRATHS